ncbi:MAG: phenylalanine--tRNA ligase subunit beta [Nitrosomonadales bacterium]
MKFSLNWLQDFFDEKLDLANLVDKLTMAGLEVDEVISFTESLKNIVVGEITSINKHPDADKLNVCQVNVGSQTLQIVCGASNARKGIKVPCALVGAKLPGFEIKKAKLRGVESLGMLCSAKELGLKEDADGLYELDDNLKPGIDIITALSLNDSIIDVSLTPNRADCLSILGIAREVAALNNYKIKLPTTNSIKHDKSTKDISVSNQESCPRYCALEIRSVDNSKKLPEKIISYLKASGIDSINPLVDLTNYVMLELGQPMHVFDLDKLQGPVVVRNANKSEKITLLNGTEITLKDELVIADDSGPVALAGVMGGLSTSTQISTKNILVEAAFFNPNSIAGVARSFSLHTESSHRFERGVDYNLADKALLRLASLISDYCGGAVSEMKEIRAKFAKIEPIVLSVNKISKILGYEIQLNDVIKSLKSLQLEVEEMGEKLKINIPSYRFDLKIEEDIIEEVIRLNGYDNIKSSLPQASIKPLPIKSNFKNDLKIKNLFVQAGYHELISYSFIDEKNEGLINGNTDPVRIDNPIASNLNVMRSHLWASHIEAMQFNVNRGYDQLKFFEIANTYKLINNKIVEEKVLSGLVYGYVNERAWNQQRRLIDFFDVKGDLEKIFSGLVVEECIEKDNFQQFHPGKIGNLKTNKQIVGILGNLHPSITQKIDIDLPIFLFEVKLDKVIENTQTKFEDNFKSLPVKRDISVLVERDVSVGEMISEVKKANIKNIIDFKIFDLYQGDKIQQNKKSVAFLILMQDTYKTLEENEVEKIVQTIINILEEKFKAELRN